MSVYRPHDRVRCEIPTIGLRQGWLYCVHAVSPPDEDGVQYLFLNRDAWNNGDGHRSNRFRLVRPEPRSAHER